MVTVKVLEITDLAELIVSLLKNGATASVKKTGDGYWTVTVEGF